MDGVAGGLFADVLSFSVGQTRESVADVDSADIGWATLRLNQLIA